MDIPHGTELADNRLGPAGTPGRPGARDASGGSDVCACAPGHGLPGEDAGHRARRRALATSDIVFAFCAM